MNTARLDKNNLVALAEFELNLCCEYSRVKSGSIGFRKGDECLSKETFQVRGWWTVGTRLVQPIEDGRRGDRAVFGRSTAWFSLFFFSVFFTKISLGRKIVSGKKYKGSDVTGQKESEARPTDRGWTAIPRQDARAWQCVRISARRGLQRSAPSDQGGAVHLVCVQILIAVVLPRRALLEQRNGRWFPQAGDRADVVYL